MKLRLKKLSMRGSIHMAIPAVVIVGMAAVGTYRLVSGNAAPVDNWTPITGSFARDSDTPDFTGCVASQTTTDISLMIQAVRHNNNVVSQTVQWSQNSSLNPVDGTVKGDKWHSQGSTVKLTVPKGDYVVISYQTETDSIKYLTLSHAPTNLMKCPS